MNERWSLDLVYDTLLKGRRMRTLNVVDELTRECLAIEFTRRSLVVSLRDEREERTALTWDTSERRTSDDATSELADSRCHR